jgi:hypothetical protein
MNREGASFCDGCGARLTGGCPKCGAQGRVGARFCDECGSPLGAPAPAGVAAAFQEPAPATSPSSLSSSLVASRYQILRYVGEGGKKRVYLARDSRLDREVALSFIKTESLDEAGLVRLRREAQAMGRLGDHPNIVTVFDVGDENGQPYIVSQFMAGGALDEQLRSEPTRRLPLDRCIRIADELAQALDHAHAREVVHRDLKPANVWLRTDGSACLGDFGLAVSLDRSRLTLEGMMVGTVAYMAPEQAMGRPPEPRSDLYSLGAMLYELVTGRPPFLGDDAVAIISQHINTPPVAPSWHNPEVPRALEALILRLLAKAPEDRPESARAVGEALQALTRSSGSGVEPAPTEGDPLDRLATGVFVGREAEMDRLRAAFEEALSGRGRVVLLMGDPGIGKTRTSEEAVTYARLRHAQALWGRCYEGEGAPPYWPWIQAIRSWVHDRDPKLLLSEMGSGAADVAEVVSEIRERLPGLPRPPQLDPEQARFRLFDGVTTFLKNASREQPLVLVLDDLHWADRASLLLLQFLARELRGARLLVIGTYRDIELGRRHPITLTLGELAHEQLAERIVLRGLSERDVARFIEVSAGIEPPPALVEAVFRETEGNPFFVNEVVRLLVSEGRLKQPDDVQSWSMEIPQSVRETIGRRLDRLSPTCNDALTIASVLGREFGLDALESLTGLSEERLLEALEEALSARVIIEVPRAAGRYSFAHALIRETLYQELSAARRVRLHRQIGEVLERLHASNPEPHLAELSHHFREAAQIGSAEKALDYAVRAAERAASLSAHEEAARQYEMALEMEELLVERDARRRFGLLNRRGECLWASGAYAEAREAFSVSADLARRLGAPELLARAALGYAGRLPAFEAGIFAEPLVALLEEALSALGNEESALRARVMARLSAALLFTKEEERRRALGLEAIAVARRAGDRSALCEVLRNIHWALWAPDNGEERLALTTEFSELAREIGDRELELDGRVFMVSHLLEKGALSRAEVALDAVEELAKQSRQAYYLWVMAALRGLFLLLEGRFEEAEKQSHEALAMGQRTGNQNALFIFGA